MSYKHVVQYYETDKMGIVHHSNYIRWMEEARVDFLRRIGYGYEKLEEEGIISPVTGITCKYRASATFADEIDIEVSVSEFRGVSLKLRYVMTGAEGRMVFEGESEHCFLSKEGGIIRLSKRYPELDGLLKSLIKE